MFNKLFIFFLKKQLFKSINIINKKIIFFLLKKKNIVSIDSKRNFL
jgi:CMP-N-acetylneuraminic acid synthetase